MPKMIVAGIGLRQSAILADLRAILARALQPPDALAMAEDKFHHPVFTQLASEFTLLPIPLSLLHKQAATTPSPRQPPRYGALSVAEAAALAGAGQKARLIQPKIIGIEQRITLALAISDFSNGDHTK